MRKRYALPAYLPDQLPDGILTAAENVLPAANGYRPVKSLAAISDPLSATFKGGGAFVASDGTTYLLAGTAEGLDRYSAGSWTSLLTGMTIADRWRFAQFGNYVVAVNSVATQEVDLSAGTADALTDAPPGNAVAVIGDYVAITRADADLLKVSWSAFNNHREWTPAVDQAGFQIMQTGGALMGIAGGEYGVLLQRFRLVRMERTGDNTAPFQFPEITTNVGCASAGSIVQAGRTVFFLSDRGFMALDDGAQLRPIGNEKFDQSFRDAVSPDDYEKLWAVVDPKRSLVMWGIPGTPGRIWVYNWVLDRPSTIAIPFAGMFAGYESSMTLEQVSDEYPDLDTMPYSLDDPRFQGGDPRMYVATAANEIGTLSGPNLPATMTLERISPADPNVSRVRGAWLDSDAIDGVTVTMDARQVAGRGRIVTTSGHMQRSGRIPLRARGKSLGVTIQHAAASQWSYTKAIDLDFDTGGLR